MGGACTAAAFLKRFIDEGRDWAHLDIAGPAMYSKVRAAKCVVYDVTRVSHVTCSLTFYQKKKKKKKKKKPHFFLENAIL
jgi:hypothetical protein